MEVRADASAHTSDTNAVSLWSLLQSSQHDMDRTETVLVRLPGPFDRDSDTPVPHEGGVHLLDDINAERSSSNPSRKFNDFPLLRLPIIWVISPQPPSQTIPPLLAV